MRTCQPVRAKAQRDRRHRHRRNARCDALPHRSTPRETSRQVKALVETTWGASRKAKNLVETTWGTSRKVKNMVETTPTTFRDVRYGAPLQLGERRAALGRGFGFERRPER